VRRRGEGFAPGDRVGVAWLHTGLRPLSLFASLGRENLCLAPRHSRWDVDGGYADHVVVPAAVRVIRCRSRSRRRPWRRSSAPGIIGYRATREPRPQGPSGSVSMASAPRRPCHQIARFYGCAVYVATRGPRHQALARRWAQSGSGTPPPARPTRSTRRSSSRPPGDLVLPALAALAVAAPSRRRHSRERHPSLATRAISSRSARS